MLIDTLSIVYSNNVATAIIDNPLQQNFINDWSDLLLSVGWTQTAAYQATASVVFPLGVPITDGILGPLTPVNCTAFPGSLAIGAEWYTFYDPFHQTPVPGMCIFVPEDTTYGGTLANLATAINGGTVWFAVVTQNSPVNFTLSLTALAGGPEFNGVVVQSSGLTAGPDTSIGGGYQMQSSGSTNSAVYQCSCILNPDTGPSSLHGNLFFTFTIDGQNFSYDLLDAIQGTLGTLGALGVGPVPQYTVIANPFGFAVFDQPWDDTTQQFRVISLFCMAPYFPDIETVPPSEHFVPAYAVFVIGPNQIGGPPSWNDDHMYKSTMCLDAVPFQTVGFNPSARLLAYRSPNQPLLSPQASMFHYGAYVQFGSAASNADPAWVVGKLWDVCIVTDYVASDAIIDGRQFLAFGGSDGSAGTYTVCTVMMASAAPAGSTRTGTVNLFGDGVTWVSGQLFDPVMVGAPITIGGTSYIVKSVTDTTHLVLTTALTIASGVTYTSTDPTVVETGGQSPLCIAATGSAGGAGIFSNSGH